MSTIGNCIKKAKRRATKEQAKGHRRKVTIRCNLIINRFFFLHIQAGMHTQTKEYSYEENQYEI